MLTGCRLRLYGTVSRLPLLPMSHHIANSVFSVVVEKNTVSPRLLPMTSNVHLHH